KFGSAPSFNIQFNISLSSYSTAICKSPEPSSGAKCRPSPALIPQNEGADPNFRGAVNRDGYGGHTALFHTTVSYTFSDSSKAKALLKAGGNPDIRATIRKQLRYMGQRHLEEMRIFEEVTAVEFAHQFQMQTWVSHASIALIEDKHSE
ncbi:MAG: hypothetical protein AAFR87_06670, partial [Bacteroidota bacterium]